MRATPDSRLRLSSSSCVNVLEPVQGVDTALFIPKVGDSVKAKVKESVEVPAFSVPNLVTVKWLNGSDEVYESSLEIVSRHYFEIEDFRAQSSIQDDFNDEELYPDDLVFFARQAATDIFEQATRRSFVCRIGRTKDYGRDNIVTLDHGDVRELITDGYHQISENQLERTSCQVYPLFVEYYYGAEYMPYEVSNAVKQLAEYMLRPSNRPLGATGESSDAGYIHFTTAGRDGATSIPEVNAAIEQFGRGVQCVW